MSSDFATKRAVAGLLQSLAAGIDQVLQEATGKQIGFALVVFTPPAQPGEKSDAQYVSNCARSDIEGAFAELLKRWQEGATIKRPPLDA